MRDLCTVREEGGKVAVIFALYLVLLYGRERQIYSRNYKSEEIEYLSFSGFPIEEHFCHKSCHSTDFFKFLFICVFIMSIIIVVITIIIHSFF